MVAPASAVVEIVHWSKPCWLKGWSPGRKVVVLWTIFRAVETPVPTVYPIPSHTQKCWVIDLTDLPPSTKSRIPPLKCQKCQKFQITCPVVNLLVDTIKINFTTNFWSKDLLWCATSAKAINWLKWSLCFIYFAHFRVLFLKDSVCLVSLSK